jgi:Leucine-rich repeat (LRR) protein
MANKEHILDARLSDQWARHFSIFSGLRLRASDRIEKFVQSLPKYSPQLPLLKVLDLEGVNCFDKTQYLKDICNKILLLKYLSLRGTNVTKLPIEINNLHELEVLDIRQTRVPENATRNVLLLKLRRLLADRVDSSSGMCAKSCSAVQIPKQIERMENLEVLSTVKASGDGSDLEEIRKLWQLRKLGVVIQDNYNHLRTLFRAISDLHECLLSLSVTISPITKTKKVPSSEKRLLQENMEIWRNKTRKLESLTINEVRHTEKVQLLESLAKGCEDLAKVILSGTLLEQESLMVLAMLPKLRSLRLRPTAYSETKLTFNKEEFPQLKYFLVEGPDMTDGKTSMTGTDIKFEDGATTELEKIVLSFTNIRSLCGIDNLPKLKELELEANQFLLSFGHDEAAPEQHTESRDDEQNTQSEAPKKNTESGGTESRAAAEKDTQSTDPDEQNTNTRATELGTQSRVPEQNPERNIVPEQYTESRFTLKKDKFQHLVCFRFKDSKRTDIIFETGAAPELKKIILSLDDKRSKLTGVSDLPKLNDVELKGDKFLLSFFYNANHVTKMTLRDTQLKQEDIHELGKKQSLRCLVLSDKSYDESKLTFNKDDFPMLDHLIVECHNIDSISFTDESAAPKLIRIVWSFSKMKSLSGISYLPKLKEIECSGEHVPYQVRKEITAHEGKPVLTHKRPPHQSQATGEESDDKASPLISCF